MTNNIPKICAAFEMWQDNDCIGASITLELIMRYLADDPEIDYVVSDADRISAYQDYIKRQDENLKAKTLIIRELNKDRMMNEVYVVTECSDDEQMCGIFSTREKADTFMSDDDSLIGLRGLASIDVWTIDDTGGIPK